MPLDGHETALVDVVVVSYKSGATLRRCVEPLAQAPGVTVTVVDNASPQDPHDAVADLPVRFLRAPRNGGFSYGCNLGAAQGRAPFVLLLNPDSQLRPAYLDRLVDLLADDPSCAIAGPRILEDDGALA